MKLLPILRLSTFILSAFFLLGSHLHAVFNITIQGLEDSPYRSYFEEAAAFWESIIVDYQYQFVSENDVVLNTGLTITANVEQLELNVLGQAGPMDVVYAPSIQLCYAITGEMTFNSLRIDSMIANGSFGEVVRHEMAHVLGFGTLWSIDLLGNGILYNDVLDASGNYIGTHALGVYRLEFNQESASYIPVEDQGGAGTAGGHWKEIISGMGSTGIVDAEGRDMANELMTGWLTSPTFLSQTTIASLIDLGYIVNIPEPATIALWFGGILLLFVVLICRRH